MNEKKYERIDDTVEVVREERNVVKSDSTRYEPEEVVRSTEVVVAKPTATRTEDFIDAIYEATWYAIKLYNIRKTLKKCLSLLAHSDRRIRRLAKMKALELEKEEREVAESFYEARKRARMLCEFKLMEANKCEKCIYNWVCWGRIRV